MEALCNILETTPLNEPELYLNSKEKAKVSM
jgi:hypothetical protein